MHTTPTEPSPTLSKAQQIYSEPLILRQVYSHLLKTDLVSCLLLDEEGMGISSKELYTMVPPDIVERFARMNCPFVNVPAQAVHF